ncbi:MAG: hypothetical protein J6K75_08230 [Erysipelotrichaceae bacterium]|nr:hypothetical protein [Erysipelotrichaceae bacterium]
MMDKDTETCFAALIAIANALNLDLSFKKVNDDVINALYAIKNNQDVQIWIDTLRQDKALVVPDCAVCEHPCGRTSEVYLNEKDESKRRHAYQLIKELDSLSLNDIYQRLCECSF